MGGLWLPLCREELLPVLGLELPQGRQGGNLRSPGRIRDQNVRPQGRGGESGLQRSAGLGQHTVVTGWILSGSSSSSRPDSPDSRPTSRPDSGGWRPDSRPTSRPDSGGWRPDSRPTSRPDSRPTSPSRGGRPDSRAQPSRSPARAQYWISWDEKTRQWVVSLLPLVARPAYTVRSRANNSAKCPADREDETWTVSALGGRGGGGGGGTVRVKCSPRY